MTNQEKKAYQWVCILHGQALKARIEKVRGTR